MVLLFLFAGGRRNVMPKYIYDGPVLEFGKCIANQWKGETTAPTESRARTNLAYQFKTKHSRLPGSKITLPGKMTVIDEKEW